MFYTAQSEVLKALFDIMILVMCVAIIRLNIKTNTLKEDKEFLQKQIDSIRKDNSELKKRIDELENKEKEN